MSPQLPQEIEHLRVDNIIVADRLRHVDEKAVEELRKSIANVGLLTPISVRVVDQYTSADGEITEGACLLVAGLHRLEAVRGLGWQKVPSVIVECDDIDARLMEIAENLHRAELDYQEKADQIEEWRRLTLEKGRHGAAPGGDQPNDKGFKKTAAALGIDERTVRRAEKIASIAPEAKDAIREAGLNNSQKALLAVASAPREEQVARVQEIQQARAIRIDNDIKDRAATYIAEILAERPAEQWPAIKEALYDCGAKNIATAMANLVGTAVMDRRYA